MTGENLNVQHCSGEQYTNNKVHHTKRSKHIKDYVGSKGQGGIELVSAMMWAVSFGHNTRVTDAMVERRYGRLQQHGDVKQLQVFMDNWADGEANNTISYEVHSGLYSLRKLYHQPLPDIATQQQLLVQ